MSSESFHVVCLRKLIWIYSFLEACNFTGQNITETFTSERQQLGSYYARACGMNNGKKCELCAHDFACAGLFLSPLLSLMRGTKRMNTIRFASLLMTNLSTHRYLEYLHCYLR